MLFHKKKTAMIVGAGRFGAEAAAKLSERGCRLIVIDRDEEALAKLPAGLDDFLVAGDGTDVKVLEKAGIKKADMLVSAAEDDNVNVLVSQIASRIYHVPSVYARFEDRCRGELVQAYGVRPIVPYALSADELARLDGEMDEYEEAAQ